MRANVTGEPYPESDSCNTGAATPNSRPAATGSGEGRSVVDQDLAGTSSERRTLRPSPLTIPRLKPVGLFDYVTWDQAKRARTLRFRSETFRRG